MGLFDTTTDGRDREVYSAVSDVPPEASSERVGEGDDRSYRPTECAFVTGEAGTGKTYQARQALADDPSWGVLAASTGIAAVNLDTVTINSLLGYFNTASLLDAYYTRQLERRMHGIALAHQGGTLAIDEASMLSAQAVTWITRAADDANQYLDIKDPLKLMLIGDFAQLPPVKEAWAFDSDEWHRYAAHTTRLTKVWRQTDAAFLSALNAARRGQGADCADILSRNGVQWNGGLQSGFDGTTIVAKNDQVRRYNDEALSRLPGKAFDITARRWGQQRPQWGMSQRTKEWGIAPQQPMKLGAYVMLLSNKYGEAEPGETQRPLIYANGDCGHVIGWNGYTLTVELLRNGDEVQVDPITRNVGSQGAPDNWPSNAPSGMQGWHPALHRSARKEYVTGQINYYPVRLAWASTIHKSQGLTLDRVQFDVRDRFVASPHMIYVALSRCRTLEGLRIVGDKDRFIAHCQVDKRVEAWL